MANVTKWNAITTISKWYVVYMRYICHCSTINDKFYVSSHKEIEHTYSRTSLPAVAFSS